MGARASVGQRYARFALVAYGGWIGFDLGQQPDDRAR